MLNLTVYVKSVLQLLALAIAGWLIYTIRGLIIYIAVAGVIALIAKPLTNLICKIPLGNKRIPRWLAAATTVLLFIFVFGLGSSFLLPRLFSEFILLRDIDYGKAYTAIFDQIELIQYWLVNNNLGSDNMLDEVQLFLKDFLSFGSVRSTFTGILGGLGNLAIAMFSVLFILFFVLKEENVTDRLITDYVPDHLTKHITNMLPKIKTTLFRYSIGLLAQMVGIFTIVYTGLSIFDIPGALAIAAFTAFINIIPYLGPMIGAMFGLIVGVGQVFATQPDEDLGLVALKIISVFAVTQLTDNFVYQPLIFSRSIKAHPLEIFLVISIAGLLGGVAGMIIAVPAYSMIRIVGKEFFTDTKAIRSLTKNV